MTNTVTYDGDVFKSISCIPQYAEYKHIYVAKNPHVDDKGNSFQVINTDWYGVGKWHPIKSCDDKDGYYIIGLPAIKGRGKTTAKVHRLVLLTWNEDIPSNYQTLDINHRDECKRNNHLDNLELVTHQVNCTYGTRNQRIANSMIRSGHTARVVAIDIQTKQEWRFDSTHECARRLGVWQCTVCRCINGRNHKHHGFVFCRQDEYSPAKVAELIEAATRCKN